MRPQDSILAAVLLALAGTAAAETEIDKVRKRVVVQGKACPDPITPCPLPGSRFKENELSFQATRGFRFDRGEDRSRPFYAVVLASGRLCGIADADRVSAQKDFPGNKVFLHRYFCEDFGDKVTYTGVDRKLGFVAVYAGETPEEAQAFLEKVKATGRYAGANVRRMEVVIRWQLE